MSDEDETLSVADIIGGNFPALSLAVADFSDSGYDSSSNAPAFEIEQRELDKHHMDEMEEEESVDAEEMIEALEEDVDDTAHLLSTSWSEGLSIKHISIDDNADELMDAAREPSNSNSRSMERRSSVPDDLWRNTSRDDEKKLLAGDTVDVIFERFAPYGRTIIRRVRPVYARELRRERIEAHTSCCKASYFVVLLVCLMMFGNFLNFDNVDIKTNLRVADPQMGVLYSVYTLPNVVVVLAGGALIDRIGLRWGALLFSLLVTTGCVMFAISSQIASYPLAVMGRFVFGLGGESLYVCGDAILVEYFDQSQLSRVMPLAEIFLNMGDLATFSLLPTLADLYGVTTVLWLACSVCGVSLLAVLVYSVVDYFEDINDAKMNAVARMSRYHYGSLYLLGESESESDDDDDADGAAATAAIGRGDNDEDDDTTTTGDDSHDVEQPLLGKRRRRQRDGLLRRALRRVLSTFDARYWGMAITGMCLTGAYVTLGGFASDLLEKRFDMDQTNASLTVASMTLSVLVFTPINGFIVHRLRAPTMVAMVTWALLMMCGAHLYLGVAPRGYPIIPALVVIGYAFSLVGSCIWPSLPLVVDEKHSGLAYGVLYALSNLINSALYYGAGRLIHVDPQLVSYVWASVAFLGALASVYWNYALCRNHGGIWHNLTAPHPPDLGFVVQ